MVVSKEVEHARQRRAQRDIDKKDLSAALKYGKECPCIYGTKYYYRGIYYIGNWIISRRKNLRWEEETCYTEPLVLKKVKIIPEMKRQIDEAKQRLAEDRKCWKSNTVIVVDTSGSMRESDMWGSRSRLHSVWICLAVDFIAHRLETGEGGLCDAISVLLMGEDGYTLIETQPTSWDIYNQIVDVYNNRLLTTGRGHGNYVPSLKMAEQILNSTDSSACALSICFMSDGRPSDNGTEKEMILPTVESMASKFGRRLSFSAIGIGHDRFEFEMLKTMVDCASDFGAMASFVLPSMTTSSLGLSLTSTATTLAKTQTEMTDTQTLKQRPVREVLRESRRKAHDEVVAFVSREDYWLFPAEKVVRRVYREWHDEDRRRQYSYDEAPMQHSASRFVALHKKAFGEGAERFAFRFFEVGEDGKTVVSNPLVAKESRLVLEGGEENRNKFVRNFCETQQLARRIANEFNEKLDYLHRVDNSTPRVSFLDCSVYELDDKKKGKQSVLVEEKINHMTWHKWNMNNGYVEGMEEAPEFTHDKMKDALAHLTKLDVSNETEKNQPYHKTAANGLDVIAEDDEEEESDSENDNSGSGAAVQRPAAIKFSASEVAQAFSHFSYVATGRKRLICDLQGVFDEARNELRFTDPVIHYFNSSKQHRKNVHGRTDQGRQGMAMFFDTHKACCGRLCRLVTGGFRKPRYQKSVRFSNAQSTNRKATSTYK